MKNIALILFGIGMVLFGIFCLEFMRLGTESYVLAYLGPICGIAGFIACIVGLVNTFISASREKAKDDERDNSHNDMHTV